MRARCRSAKRWAKIASGGCQRQQPFAAIFGTRPLLDAAVVDELLENTGQRSA